MKRSVASATFALLVLPGCHERPPMSAQVFTSELQKECILRSLSHAFDPGGMQDVRGRYRGGKPITVIYEGFPFDSYPSNFKHFEDHQLVQISREALNQHMKDRGEPMSYMIITFNNRRPKSGVAVWIDSQGFRWNHEANKPFEGGDEFVSVEFRWVDGKLDGGKVALRGIQ